jgi:hypothetical protein
VPWLARKIQNNKDIFLADVIFHIHTWIHTHKYTRMEGLFSPEFSTIMEHNLTKINISRTEHDFQHKNGLTTARYKASKGVERRPFARRARRSGRKKKIGDWSGKVKQWGSRNRRYLAGDVEMACGIWKTVPGGAPINQLGRRDRISTTSSSLDILFEIIPESLDNRHLTESFTKRLHERVLEFTTVAFRDSTSLRGNHGRQCGR